MNRPRIICHMNITIDGKIDGESKKTKTGKAVGSHYERTNASYNPDTWLCGRTTTEIAFTDHHKPQLDDQVAPVPKGDFIANKEAKMYYVSIDRSGKVGWKSNKVEYQERPTAHVIEVLSEKAPNSYKAFLRKLNISYIIAGEEYINCTQASEKLKNLFGIHTLMLSGGGLINGSFLNEGIIDELSLVVAPVTDASSKTASLFEKGDFLTDNGSFEFDLKAVEKLEEVDYGYSTAQSRF